MNLVLTETYPGAVWLQLEGETCAEWERLASGDRAGRPREPAPRGFPDGPDPGRRAREHARGPVDQDIARVGGGGRDQGRVPRRAEASAPQARDT
jgi:hypothetical protein